MAGTRMQPRRRAFKGDEMEEQGTEKESARVDQAKERAKAVKAMASAVSKWMIENDCDNPGAIPGSALRAMRRSVGL